MRIPAKLPSRILSRAVSRQLRAPLATYLGARWSSTSEGRQWSTPLAKTLTEAITTTGPVPVAAYMRQVLTAPGSGYYTSRPEGGDQFGQKGDFITSPEISQIFGELVGLWFVAEWMLQGRKSSGVQLIEVGPGRGTLMDDMLRAIRNFKSMSSAIETVYLIEASPTLRAAQHKLLCGDAPLKETDIGHESTSKYSNLKIVWSEDIRLVPKDASKTPFIVAHEFFDALPIHIFESVAPPPPTDTPSTPEPPADLTNPASVAAAAARQQQKRPQKTNEWRELLVSPVPPNSTHATLNTPVSLRDSTPVPDFQLTKSTGPTPHSMYLPHTSARYAALLQRPGSVIEISPESLSYVSDFAERIGGKAVVSPQKKAFGSAATQDSAAPSSKPTPSGAALILDYGPLDTVPTNSLRGIRHHRAVSPLALPGQVDVSADVDFVALAEAAINASPGVEVHGPVEQAAFLEAMGVRERAKMLVRKAEGAKQGDEGKEFKERIEKGAQRLVDRGPNGMGKLYKALAIVPHFPEKAGRRPVGFGGDVKV